MVGKQRKILVERMHFSNPFFLIAYFYSGIILYLYFSYKGGFIHEILTEDVIIYFGLIGILYVAFAIKHTLTEIHLYLEIHPIEHIKSPLRALFASEVKFLKFRDNVLERIFSKEILISVIFILLLASVFIFIDVRLDRFGKPFGVEDAGIYGILINVVIYYFGWWLLCFAGFGFLWVLYCLIVAIKKIGQEQTESLRIAESIKTLKVLTKGENENIRKKSKDFYTYSKLLKDYEEIMGITYFIALSVAIIAVFYSLGGFVIPGILFNEWRLHVVSFIILLDIIAILTFITPQFSAHKLLKKVKREIYCIISDLYEQQKLILLNKYASFSPVESSMVKDIEFLKKIVDEIGDLSTWLVKIGPALRLTTATALSLMPYLASYILK